MNRDEVSEDSKLRKCEKNIENLGILEEGLKKSSQNKLEVERSNLDIHSVTTGLPASQGDQKNIDVPRQLGKILLQREERKMSKEDSDYVRDSTETTSSGGSSSTSGYVAGKVRRVPRAVRNKNTDVRRNPVRVKKKTIDKDFTRPRQRLLTAKRKAALSDLEFTKRGKLSTMPYMNTRSVTRKMYNVGATYQAPTKRDETEWKEWPVHGMHERPVFHPQVGLAVEYLGKYFMSIDGISYREIIDHPEIEVVSVDPRSASIQKKRNRKTRLVKETAPSIKTTPKSQFRKENKSFETCMHGSLHCVLGYCSQIISPIYKATECNKTNSQREESNDNKSEVVEKKIPEVKKEADHKTEVSVQDGYAHPTPRNNSTQRLKPLPRLFPMQTMYITNSQKSISFTNVKTLQASGMKVQEVLQSSTKNPLILVNATDAKNSSTVRGRILKPVPNNLSLIKLDNTSLNEDNVFELSPIYKKAQNETSISDNSKLIPRSTTGNKLEFALSKCRFGLQQEKQNKQTPRISEYSEPSVKGYGSAAISNKTWPTTDASEIAKILSDYNKTATRKAENPNYSYPNNYKEEFEYPQTSTPKRNLSIKFPQGKWRRLHFTVEKMKEPNNSENNVEGKRTEVTFPGKQVDQKGLVANQVNTSNPESFIRNQLSRTDEEVPKVQPLHELLENTAVLYCAAAGVHQDDLADYIDSLDTKQSVRWLEDWSNNSV